VFVSTILKRGTKNGKSDLYVVRSNGKFEYVNEWIAIGSGQITVKDYVKRKWNAIMTMSNFANSDYVYCQWNGDSYKGDKNPWHHSHSWMCY